MMNYRFWFSERPQGSRCDTLLSLAVPARQAVNYPDISHEIRLLIGNALETIPALFPVKS